MLKYKVFKKVKILFSCLLKYARGRQMDYLLYISGQGESEPSRVVEGHVPLHCSRRFAIQCAL